MSKKSMLGFYQCVNNRARIAFLKHHLFPIKTFFICVPCGEKTWFVVCKTTKVNSDHSVASDLGLYCLPMTHKKEARHSNQLVALFFLFNYRCKM